MLIILMLLTTLGLAQDMDVSAEDELTCDNVEDLFGLSDVELALEAEVRQTLESVQMGHTEAIDRQTRIETRHPRTKSTRMQQGLYILLDQETEELAAAIASLEETLVDLEVGPHNWWDEPMVACRRRAQTVNQQVGEARWHLAQVEYLLTVIPKAEPAGEPPW